MFKVQDIKRALVLIVIGAALSVLTGCDLSQLTADSGSGDIGKLAPRASLHYIWRW